MRRYVRPIPAQSAPEMAAQVSGPAADDAEWTSLAASKSDGRGEGLLTRVQGDLVHSLKVDTAASVLPQVLNLWTPTPIPATLHRLTPMVAYDINTKLPFHILETDQVRMEPLIVRHADDLSIADISPTSISRAL